MQFSVSQNHFNSTSNSKNDLRFNSNSMHRNAKNGQNNFKFNSDAKNCIAITHTLTKDLCTYIPVNYLAGPVTSKIQHPWVTACIQNYQ